jgi:hypothetical protein
MPKLEYESEPEEKQIETPLPNDDGNGDKPKDKKPRSQKQIDATNKMREALKARTENNKKLKEDLEAKMDDTLNHKLIKKEINKKVNMKLKQIVDNTNDDVSDSDEEIIIIPKKKVVKTKAPQVKAVSKVKAEPTPPIQKQQGFAIRFV